MTGTTYTDRGPGQKKYYYRVFAEDSLSRLSDPAKVTAVVTAPPGALPQQLVLQSADIGNPTPAGSTNILTGADSYDMLAGGADVQGVSDQFRFASTRITGDFDLSVRVDSLSAADVWSKAGIMARSFAGRQFGQRLCPLVADEISPDLSHDHRWRHHRGRRWHASVSERLASPDAHRQHLHGLFEHGWGELDGAVERHGEPWRDDLRRPGGNEPQYE